MMPMRTIERNDCSRWPSWPSAHRSSRQRMAMDVSAPHIRQRMRNDERAGIECLDDAHEAAYLEARDDAVEDQAIGVGGAAAAAEDGDAAREFADDSLPDDLTLIRDDGDRGEFLDAVEDEVQRLRRRRISEHRVERLLHPQRRHRDQEQNDVEGQDDIADLQ